jgi:hypothetical protein
MNRYTDTPVGRFLARQDEIMTTWNEEPLTDAMRAEFVYDEFDMVADIVEATALVEAAKVVSA